MSSTNQSTKKHRRIIIVGQKAVGKSSISSQFCKKLFPEKYHPTIEETFRKNVSFHNSVYDTEIVDTAGQNTSSILPESYVIDADGFILVYSVANKNSFKLIETLNDKIINETQNNNIPRVVVGNKADVQESERCISEDEGRKLAEKLGCSFFEVSAKLNENVENVFLTLLARIEKVPLEKAKAGGCNVM